MELMVRVQANASMRRKATGRALRRCMPEFRQSRRPSEAISANATILATMTQAMERTRPAPARTAMVAQPEQDTEKRQTYRAARSKRPRAFATEAKTMAGK